MTIYPLLLLFSSSQCNVLAGHICISRIILGLNLMKVIASFVISKRIGVLNFLHCVYMCFYVFVFLILCQFRGIPSNQLLNIWMRFLFLLKDKFACFGMMKTICFLVGWGNSGLWLVKYKPNTLLCHCLENWNKTLYKLPNEDKQYLILFRLINRHGSKRILKFMINEVQINIIVLWKWWEN